jgi:hypothetical protein
VSTSNIVLTAAHKLGRRFISLTASRVKYPNIKEPFQTISTSHTGPRGRMARVKKAMAENTKSLSKPLPHPPFRRTRKNGFKSNVINALTDEGWCLR